MQLHSWEVRVRLRRTALIYVEVTQSTTTDDIVGSSRVAREVKVKIISGFSSER